jgi:hypothetical protein
MLNFLSLKKWEVTSFSFRSSLESIAGLEKKNIRLEEDSGIRPHTHWLQKGVAHPGYKAYAG